MTLRRCPTASDAEGAAARMAVAAATRAGLAPDVKSFVLGLRTKGGTRFEKCLPGALHRLALAPSQVKI